MDLSLSPEERTFQQEIARWLDENLPAEWRQSRIGHLAEPEQVPIRREWSRRLGQAGWLGINWPAAYGGRGAALMETVLYHAELRRHDAPPPADRMGLSMIGPVLIEAGSEAQKQRHLPPIIRGEVIWVQGFSEPNAGSDLAGLQTRADRDGDDWVVNGQKIWSSSAHLGDWCGLLVRTDQEAPKHRGISFLLVDMRIPGIRVRPIRQLTGASDFNEMYFNNVRVPLENVLGEVNGGWRVANRLMSYERGTDTMNVLDVFQARWEQMREFAATTRRAGRLLIEDPRVRERFAQSYADIRLMRLVNLRFITWYQRGRLPAEESSYMKLCWAAAEQGLAELSMLLAGPDGLEPAGSPHAVQGGDWLETYLFSRAVTIYGGSQDIQRNIIAERLFGLPR